MQHILKVKNYSKKQNELHSIAQFTDSLSLDTYIKSIYYCANHLLKLFDDLKIDELPIGFHDERVIFEKTFNSLEDFNNEHQRNCFLNFNNIIFNKNEVNLPVKKIEIIGECPNPFIDNNLGFEFVLLHKTLSEAKRENKEISVSEYGKNLIRLCEQLTNQKFSEITITDEFINGLLFKHKENYELMVTTKKLITSYSKQLDILTHEIEDINTKIQQLEKEYKSINESLLKKSKINRLDLQDAEKARNEIIVSSFNIIDKAKIKMFETFQDIDSIGIIFKEKENKHALKYIKIISDLKKEQEQIQNNFKINQSNFENRVNLLNEKIENIKNFKQTIISYVEVQKKNLLLMENKVLNTNIINENLVDIRKRNITNISKENNVFFIHSLPSWKNEQEMFLNMQSARFLNPTLKAIPYKLNTQLFENKTNNIFGLLISKGILSELSNKNVEMLENNHQINYSIQEQNNKNNKVKEVVIENTQTYGYIIQLDYGIKLNENAPADNPEVNLGFIKNAYHQLKKLNDYTSQYNIEVCPIIFMVNGKLLEIESLKDRDFIIQERRLDSKDAENIIKQLFVVKELTNVKDIQQPQIMNEKSNQKIIKDLIINIQDYQQITKNTLNINKLKIH